MKTHLPIIACLLSLLFAACSPGRTTQQPQQGLPTGYQYKFTAETPAYERPSIYSKKLGVFTTSDTVSTEHRLTFTQGWIAVIFLNRLVWVDNPGIIPVNETRIKTTSSSTNVPNRIFGHDLTNGFGIGIGGTTESALLIDALYKYRRHAFHIGYAHQFNGQLGEKKTTQLANYGRTVVGINAYFSAFSAGYDFWLNNRLALGVDGHLGYNNGFANYSDKRFSAGGYHMITGYETAAGYGAKLSFLPISYVMVSGGYNTLTGANFTLYIVSFGNRRD